MADDQLKSELSAEELQRLYAMVQTADEPNLLMNPKAAEASEQSEAVDEFGLPFDPEDYYNAAPVQFEEEVNALWIVTTSIHYAATRYNRHSPNYFTCISELEKNIKQLGKAS